MPLPLLIAASAGASAIKNNNNQGSTIGVAGMPGSRQSPNFQQVMTAMQQNGVSLKELMALSGPSLQAKIKTLTPQQQQALTQQLNGAKVTVQGPNGLPIAGIVSQVHLGGAYPSFDMAGGNFTLDRIQAINQAQV